ncbi:MAG: zinc ribbon domain-containing protein [Nitrososphaerota archaeon]|nr:zinc ribbon domain-containing protein [Nitrososphaerota archaeon]
MGDGPRLGCPYCGSALTDRNVCPHCGTICDRCGTPYKGSYCARCYGGEGYISPGSNPQGEIAPARYDGIVRPKIEGGGSVSRREAHFLDSTFLREGAKETHDRAEKAVRFLRLSDEAKRVLAEQVETMASKLMKSSGGTVNREKAVLHALYVGAKALGIPATEVQECLARSGFRMSLDSVTVRVECGGAAAVEVFVNGSPRKARAAVIGGSEGETMRKMAKMIIGSNPRSVPGGDVVFCSVKVPLLLGDALDSEGDVLVHFENASIIDYPPELKAELLDDDQSTLKLTLDPKKCFTYFRLLKEVALNPSPPSPAAGLSREPAAATAVINPDRFIGRYLNIEARYPVSSMLADAAGCTQRLRSLALADFRRSVERANGRSPETLAVESLYFSDREVFRSLPAETRSRVRALALKTTVLPRDRSYAGVEGVLIPSELGRDPPPERDGWQTSAVTTREGGR